MNHNYNLDFNEFEVKYNFPSVLSSLVDRWEFAHKNYVKTDIYLDNNIVQITIFYKKTNRQKDLPLWEIPSNNRLLFIFEKL